MNKVIDHLELTCRVMVRLNELNYNSDAWLNSFNEYFGMSPIELMDTEQGCAIILEYLNNLK